MYFKSIEKTCCRCGARASLEGLTDTESQGFYCAECARRITENEGRERRRSLKGLGLGLG